MITSLSLRNFKAWRTPPDIPLSRLTGLFGANSAGKSSLIQLLLMMKQTVQSPDRALVLNLGDERSLVELGTYRDIVHRHAADQPVSWAFSWRLPQKLRASLVSDSGERKLVGETVEFAAEVASNGSGRILVNRFHYRFAGHELGMGLAPDGRYNMRVEPDDLRLERRVGRPPTVNQTVKCYGFPDAIRAAYKNAELLGDLQLALETLFAHVYYIGPLREYPKRRYTWSGAEPSTVGGRGEDAIAALLAARQRGRYLSPGPGKRKRSLEEHVAWWLRQLGLIDSFRVEEMAAGTNTFRALVRKDARSEEVLLTDVGFGVSQVLPVLTLCFYVPEGSTIILEHPEIHLHPAVQSGLADVLIDAMNTRKVQFIVESHSEHLLRRLQRRVADGTVKTDDIALYFCDRVGGESRLSHLNVNLYGDIDNWPDGFFGDEMEEIAETELAGARRRQAAG